MTAIWVAGAILAIWLIARWLVSSGSRRQENQWPQEVIDRYVDRVNVDDIGYDFGRALSADRCPYCNYRFAAAPKATRKKCPSCQKVFRRATMPGRRRVLLTIAEADALATVRSQEYRRRYREVRIKQFQYERKQARLAGSLGYIWRTAGDGDVCMRCRQNEGKYVGWDDEPAGGHVGHSESCPNGYCRCWASPVIPDP